MDRLIQLYAKILCIHSLMYLLVQYSHCFNPISENVCVPDLHSAQRKIVIVTAGR